MAKSLWQKVVNGAKSAGESVADAVWPAQTHTVTYPATVKAPRQEVALPVVVTPTPTPAPAVTSAPAITSTPQGIAQPATTSAVAITPVSPKPVSAPRAATAKPAAPKAVAPVVAKPTGPSPLTLQGSNQTFNINDIRQAVLLVLTDPSYRALLKGDKGDKGDPGSSLPTGGLQPGFTNSSAGAIYYGSGGGGGGGNGGSSGGSSSGGSGAFSGTFAGSVSATSLSVSGAATFTTLPTFPLQQNYLLVGNATNVATPLAPGTSGDVLTIDGTGTPVWGSAAGSYTFTVASSPASTTQNINSGNTVTFASGSSNNLTAVVSSLNTVTYDIVNNPTFATSVSTPLLTLGTAGVNRGVITLAGQTSGAVTLQTTDVTASYTLKLPNSAGSSGQVLQTDGSGNLSWVPAGSGSVTSVATGAGLTGGPITSTGTVSVATNGIVDSMIRQSAATSVIGRSAGTTGNVADIVASSNGDVLRRAGGVLGFGTIPNTSVTGLGTLSTQNGTFSGTSSGTNTGDQTIALTGDVTGSGTGSFPATITAGSVTYSKLQNASANTVLARAAGTTGSVSEVALNNSELLGRGSAGNVAAISLGSGLSMTGNVLSATGSSGGVSSVGTIDSQTKSANGAVIVATDIFLQNADASFPGLVSTGTQTFAGSKTLTGGSTLIKPASNSVTTFQVQPSASATPVFNVDTTNSLVGIGTAAPAYLFDARTASSAANLHVGANSADSGLYLVSNGGSVAYMAGGAAFNGVNWVAKSTEATLFGGYNGNTRIFGDTGLTAGNTFTPTERFTILGANGNIGINAPSPGSTLTVGGGATVGSGYTGTAAPSNSLLVQSAIGVANTSPSALLSLGTAGATGGSLSLAGSTSGTVTINTSAAAGTYTLTLPVDDGTSGQYLQTDGNGLLSWVTGSGGSGVTTIGTIDSQSKSANGAVISGANLVLQNADSTFPGLVSTGTQTFTGAKTFITSLAAPSLSNAGNLTLNASGANSLFLQTNSTNRLSIDGNGAVSIADTGSFGTVDLLVNGTATFGQVGGVYAQSPSGYPTLGFNSYYANDGFNYTAGQTGYGSIFSFNPSDGALNYYAQPSSLTAGSGRQYLNTDIKMQIARTGQVGISNVSPSALLTLGTAGTTAGTVSLAGSTSGTVTIQTAAAAGTWTMTLPTTAGSSGQVLQTNGSGVTSWVTVSAGSGVTTIGTLDSQTKSADGAVISGVNLVLQAADASFPGLVTATGTQAFAGNKTFTGNNTLIKPGTNSVTAFQVQPAASTTPVFNVDTTNNRIGVNTSSPLAAVDVQGGSQVPYRGVTSNGDVAQYAGTGAFAGFRVINGTSGVPYIALNTSSDPANSVGNQQAFYAYFGDSNAYAGLGYGLNSEALTYKTAGGTAGYVGVGTNAPSARLTISGTTSDQYVMRINTTRTGDGTSALEFNRASTSVENGFWWKTNEAYKFFVGQNNQTRENLMTYNQDAGRLATYVDGPSNGLQINAPVSVLDVAPSSQVGIYGSSTSIPTLTLQPASGQTADIQQWQNSSGTAVSVINSAGKLGLGNTAPSALLTLGTAGSTAGTLSLAGSSSGTVTLQTAAAAGTWSLTLPTSGGTNGYLLSTNGSGVTSWSDPGALPVRWNALQNPTGSLALTMGTNTTAFNWATGTSTNDLFSLTTDASANGTGALLNVQTGASSTVLPLRVRAGSTEALAVDASGGVGIGITTPSATGGKLVILNSAASTAAAAGINSYMFQNQSGTLGDVNGIYSGLNLGSNTARTITNYNGFSTSVGLTGDNATITNFRGAYLNPNMANAATTAITNLVGVETSLSTSGGSGSITSAYGVKVAQPSISLATTNNYGVYIADQTNAAGGAITNNYQLYSATTNPFVITSAGNVGIGTATTVAGGGLTIAPAARTSGTPSLLTVTAPADTTLTAATEATDINFNLARTIQFAGGSGGAGIATQRAVRLQSPTYAFSNANSITTAVGLDISGAPVAGTNAVIFTSTALRISAGSVGATTAASYGLQVNAQTGATNNYAATFMGGGVGIGSSSIVPVAGNGLTIAPAARTSGTPSLLTVSGPTDTTLATGENIDINFALNRTVGKAAGSYALQRAVAIQAPDYNIASSGNITEAATLAINGAPGRVTSGSITNSYGILVSGRNVSASVSNSYGLYVNAQNGATDNYAASFIGGNVGIGTSAPAGALDVAGGAGLFTGSGGITSGTSAVAISFGDSADIGRIASLQSGTSYRDLEFYNKDTRFFNLTTGSPVESMTILHTGFTGIYNNTPSYPLHVGSVDFLSGVTVARFENAGGTCDVTPNTVGGITCTSDRRFKNTISNYSGSLEKLLQLQTVSYHLNAETGNDPLHVGFIAQDLQQVLPEVVNTDKNGYLAVSYAGLTPYLVQAVQQLNQKIDLAQVAGMPTVATLLQNAGLEDNQDFTDLNLLDAKVLPKLVITDTLYVKGQIVVKGIVKAEQLEVGTPEKPNGITLYDEDTKQPYCLRMKGGTLTPTPGACAAVPDPAPVAPTPAAVVPAPEPNPTDALQSSVAGDTTTEPSAPTEVTTPATTTEPTTSAQ
jgi:hypothetical protein